MPRTITARAVIAVTAVTALALLVAGGFLFATLHQEFGRGEATIRFLFGTMVMGAPLLLALAALASWYATSAALRPVREIRMELARISASELSRRVPVPGSHDEVALLAHEVNHTLDRLERSVVRQRQFVSDASHELRNPIAAVLAGVEVTLAHPEADDQESLRQVLADARRLQAVASDLLILARLDSDVPRADAETDLTLLVAEEVATRGRRRVPVKLDLTPGVNVRGDAGQLVRLLANLLDNAERHAASVVRVELTPEVLLKVSDDGPGVPEPDVERIFERFTRLDEARGRDRGGSGLGLAIVREIAQSHGGSVRLAAPGPGAVFEVRLPPS